MSAAATESAPARSTRLEHEPGWIDPACALCTGRARRTRFVAGAHSVVECTDCGLVYVTPRRNAALLLREVYAADYWRSARPRERGYGDYLGEGELYRATFRRRFERLAAHLGPPGRALDVGCAAGFALAVLRERGWQVFGIEPSGSARALAAAELGPGAVLGETLESADLAPGGFELITLWDVLEHLPEPLAALAQVHRLLAPGGRVLIETQNVESRAARLLGRRWQHYKHDEHLHHFSPRTLARALRASGLEPLACLRRGGGKYVAPRFLVERSGRLAPGLPRLVAPFARCLPQRLWVDLGDELLAVAGAAGEGRAA